MKFADGLQSCCQGSSESDPFITDSYAQESTSSFNCSIFSTLFCMCGLFTCVPYVSLCVAWLEQFDITVCLPRVLRRKIKRWNSECQIIPVIFNKPPTGKKVKTQIVYMNMPGLSMKNDEFQIFCLAHHANTILLLCLAYQSCFHSFHNSLETFCCEAENKCSNAVFFFSYFAG